MPLTEAGAAPISLLNPGIGQWRHALL